eukprot:10303529-Lingulodinium_polyedra.AAC.1
MGLVNWTVEMANMEYNIYLLEVVALLSDTSLMAELEFMQSCSDEEDGELQEDKVIAQVFVDLIRHTLALEIAHMRYQSCRPPARFAGLLDHNPAVQAKTIAWAKDLQEALYTIEEHALSDNWYRGYLKNMVWPLTIWSREVFIGLQEAGFSSVPPDIKTDIENFCR